MSSSIRISIALLCFRTCLTWQRRKKCQPAFVCIEYINLLIKACHVKRILAIKLFLKGGEERAPKILLQKNGEEEEEKTFRFLGNFSSGGWRNIFFFLHLQTGLKLLQGGWGVFGAEIGESKSATKFFFSSSPSRLCALQMC